MLGAGALGAAGEVVVAGWGAEELWEQVREVRVDTEGAVDTAARPVAEPMPHALKSRERRLGHGWLHSARTPAGWRHQGVQMESKVGA